MEVCDFCPLFYRKNFYHETKMDWKQCDINLRFQKFIYAGCFYIDYEHTRKCSAISSFDISSRSGMGVRCGEKQEARIRLINFL
jgi:hypothetical protein